MKNSKKCKYYLLIIVLIFVFLTGKSTHGIVIYSGPQELEATYHDPDGRLIDMNNDGTSDFGVRHIALCTLWIPEDCTGYGTMRTKGNNMALVQGGYIAPLPENTNIFLFFPLFTISLISGSGLNESLILFGNL